MRSLCPHHQLVDGLLQPEADESCQGVIEDQQHDGTDKVVPLTLRVHSELPRAGAVALDNGGDAKHTAETERFMRMETRFLSSKNSRQIRFNNAFLSPNILLYIFLVYT